MPKKKHPILTVLFILCIIGLFLGAAMALILKVIGSSSGFSFSEKIGVIPIEEAIFDSQEITSRLVKFRKDNAIKAIILRIDSPGGSVGPAQEIYREVRKTIQTKKVIASLGGVAASGGYYIASAADKIVANPGTITGSIGVLMEFVQLEDLLKKLGVSLEVLKSGEFKDVGSPHRGLTERDKELLNSVIKEIQAQFIEAVAAGRKLTKEKVQEIADGRIFTGERAKELGLVDALGNFQDAVGIAKDLAGIRGEVTLVYSRKKTGRFWDIFFEKAAAALSRVFQRQRTRLEYRWDGFLGSAIKERK